MKDSDISDSAILVDVVHTIRERDGRENVELCWYSATYQEGTHTDLVHIGYYM